jgi:hypothetical protein
VLNPPVMPLEPPPGSRSNEGLTRLLGQKRAPDAVLVGVLACVLLLGLMGLAVHVLWIAAIFVMVLGLGFTIANSRRDRIDVVNQRAEAHGSRSR